LKILEVTIKIAIESQMDKGESKVVRMLADWHVPIQWLIDWEVFAWLRDIYIWRT
jgi:hypothetical protein